MSTTRKDCTASHEVLSSEDENDIHDPTDPKSNKLKASVKRGGSEYVRTSALLALACLILIAWSVYTLQEIFMKEEKEAAAKHHGIKTTEQHSGDNSFSHPACGKILCTGKCKTRVRKLVGGKVADRGDWPWMAEITFRNEFICGGVLLNKDYVITAAHCLHRKGQQVDEMDVKIFLGSVHRNLPVSQRQQFSICNIELHENYNPTTLEHDIALLKLKHSAKFTPYILPACVPDYVLNQSGIVTGWGKDKPNGPYSPFLKQVEMPLVDTKQCRQHNDQLYRRVKVYKDMHLCIGSGNKSRQYACAGDSGGGFFQKRLDRWFLQGVVSWNDPSCNSSIQNSYTVLTNVAQYANWIRSNMD